MRSSNEYSFSTAERAQKHLEQLQHRDGTIKVESSQNGLLKVQSGEKSVALLPSIGKFTESYCYFEPSGPQTESYLITIKGKSGEDPMSQLETNVEVTVRLFFEKYPDQKPKVTTDFTITDLVAMKG